VEVTPFEQLGGAEKVRAIVERFYDVMAEREPALAKLHVCTPEGKVDRGSIDRFALFLIGWLGGPQDYIKQHGHPRLRMRHPMPGNISPPAAWLRCMQVAMNDENVTGDVRRFLDARFAEVADMLRNVEG